MKKNLQFIVVIFFVTLAFLVMLNDVTNNRKTDYRNSAELYQVDNKPDVATTDLTDQE